MIRYEDVKDLQIYEDLIAQDCEIYMSCTRDFKCLLIGIKNDKINLGINQFQEDATLLDVQEYLNKQKGFLEKLTLNHQPNK